MSLDLRATTIFEDNARAWLDPACRRALNEGGTSSSKTFSIIQLLIMIAQNAKSHIVVSVVSESLPHLKKGAIRDFFNIMGEDDVKGNPNWNMTDHVYTFPNATLEFFGADEAGKVSGPRRHILFLNEGNNVPWKAAQALDVRTSKFTFVDWNPVSEFWAHRYESGGKLVQGWIDRPGNTYIHSTYLDALDVLPAEVVANIESNRDKDPNWWNIYGLGLLGKIEGLVYPYFEQCTQMPRGDVEFYGMDFGFSNDPTTLVRCIVRGDELYSQELIYEKGLTNNDIAQRLEALGVRKNFDEIWADSAEPKSIEEISQYGFNIKPAPKGPGSVEYGHQRVRQYKQFWTDESTNCIKEQRNFRYIEDKDGRLTDKTAHTFSHGMDARRYAMAGASQPVDVKTIEVYDSMQLVPNMDLV